MFSKKNESKLDDFEKPRNYDEAEDAFDKAMQLSDENAVLFQEFNQLFKETPRVQSCTQVRKLSSEDIFDNAMQLYHDNLKIFDDFTEMYYEYLKVQEGREELDKALEEIKLIYNKIFELLVSIKDTHPEALAIISANKKVEQACYEKREQVFAIRDLRRWAYPQFIDSYKTYLEKIEKRESESELIALIESLQNQRKAQQEKRYEIKIYAPYAALVYAKRMGYIKSSFDIEKYMKKTLSRDKLSQNGVNRIFQNVVNAYKNDKVHSKAKRDDILLGARPDTYIARQKIFGPTNITMGNLRKATLDKTSVDSYIKSFGK